MLHAFVSLIDIFEKGSNYIEKHCLIVVILSIGSFLFSKLPSLSIILRLGEYDGKRAVYTK